jgi:cytochrome oxidase Cu insertion factor (SCO1/SenC/PrrC family)
MREARSFRWLVGRWWFWALGVSLLFGLPLVRAFLRPVPKPPPVLGTVPRFSLVRESGAPFSLDDLRGKVWVAARFDETASPRTSLMQELAKHTRKLAEAFELVSLASDPVKETPGALAAWAQANKVNPRRWVLLSGAADQVEALDRALGLTPKTVALVDAQGRIRGRWDVPEGDPTSTLEDVLYAAELVVHEY